jgi:hypothetical protein
VKLTTEQQVAATAKEPRVSVTACAGAGKTTLIVARYAEMIRRGVDPKSIVIVTFTVKAAEELRGRLHKAGTPEPNYVGTIHSFAMRYLPDDITVASDKVAKVAEDWACSIHTEETFPKAPAIYAGKGGRIYGAYTNYLLRHGLVDFDGLLSHLLDNRRQLADFHVIVDEFQDTGPWEREIYNAFATVFCVGDSRQSLYGFRGASGTMLENSTSYSLTKSWRMPKVITDAVNQIQFEGGDRVADGHHCDLWSYSIGSIIPWIKVESLLDGVVLCRSNREVTLWRDKLRGADIQLVEQKPVSQAILKYTDWLAVECAPDNDMAFKTYLEAWVPEIADVVANESSRLMVSMVKAASRLVLEGKPYDLSPTFDVVGTQEITYYIELYPDPRERLAALYKLKDEFWDTIGWRVMTIHQAKGLEFDNVAVVLPKFFDDRLDHRRLLYVAMTRAMKRLIVQPDEFTKLPGWIPKAA